MFVACIRISFNTWCSSPQRHVGVATYHRILEYECQDKDNTWCYSCIFHFCSSSCLIIVIIVSGKGKDNFLNCFPQIYLAVALIDGAREYLEALALVADEAAEAALDNLLDVAGGGREARGDLTESNIFICFPA